ncbi:hypothetical protein SLEP1_g18006 [Rubroshorea leprosula]|uniref:Verticillium wilt resistance-like protein n=1 Tax=Rubroshorea leprosula TaxID=152421 RepID=A0AAV5J504_9ROSI|nr:hypothetical protein SLEP1_g18006 [Rubroshorea leprosula]
MEILLRGFLILMAFSLCLHLNVGSVRSLCLADQHLSLLKLKETLIFHRTFSPKLNSWDSSTQCCSWPGVTCNGSGHVIGLDLSDEGISGGIDSSSSLFNLHHLQSLNLARNSFNGTRIPSGLGKLANLRHLNLSNSEFSGQIPLRSLSVIRLNGNNISAPVPEFLGNFSNLTLLDLKWCDLHGNFPANILQLPTLQSLDISLNQWVHVFLPDFPENGFLQTLVLSETNISGTMPASIGNLKMLSTMKLPRCNLKGSIPNSIGSLANLVLLDLSWNQLSGSIPSLSMLKNLTDLDLSCNNLSGQISSTNWENLSNLANLWLNDNSLEGSIPLSLFSLPSLQSALLSNNRFSGQIGNFPVVSSSQLTELDLSSNRLAGSIPSSFFKFQGLRLLTLSSNNFSGTLELSIIQKLGNLSTLDLSFNNILVDVGFFGKIEFTNLPQLLELRLASCKLRKFPSFLKNQSIMFTLDLSRNQIQGGIPNWIFELTLQVLDLSHNSLSSVIPADIGNFLSNTLFFSISSNFFHGVIPESICKGKQLQILDLSNNSLSGTVPRCLIDMSHGNISADDLGALRVLNLKRNNLTGTIPDVFSVDCALETLNLNENLLQGTIPKSLANCKKLEVLDVGKNGINDSFPCLLSTISSLKVLVLRSNKFFGPIECPVSNETWPFLQIVDLASNKFSGKLPETFFEIWTAMMVGKSGAPATLDFIKYYTSMDSSDYLEEVTVTIKNLQVELVKLLTIFTSIDFSCNNFEGKIPEVTGELTALHVLNLSHNSLAGPIPSSLGTLHNLESLDLSSNNLSGNIPQQLGGLNFLEVLNLSYNQLEGRIPKGNQIQTFTEDSFKDNKGLCGTPLKDCGADVQPPSTVPTSKGNNSDNGTKINWNPIIVEVGFVFGLAIVILPLMFWKRWRRWYYKRVDSVLFRILPQLNQRNRNHKRSVLRIDGKRN